ncbi:L,D-transpeptidase [Mariprofundus erugo]|uniref:L,D-transpeptidase n=1 Tax=Mariprofundus erugo TaxID=2528639 RepID=A0A5R9GP25_9PROT|nr:L,D-transpeptidase [Mariprofundus erugo]TLS66689.1 L,D-transpeptidase [Mariprofundus erugo]TLS74557.1 L,D-transpeptidase [Mariprofundus erugo]
MIQICVSEQMLYHRRRTGVWYSYPVSTAANGTGNRKNSLQTPLGRHRIEAKIGAGMPPLTAFRARKACGIFDPCRDDPKLDWILSRIIRLGGCETGRNRRGAVDTFSRYIYIHGTHDEERLGTPASHGCIRMANDDIIELFEHVALKEAVIIRA